MSFGPGGSGGGGGGQTNNGQYEVIRKESAPGAEDWFDAVPDATGYENLQWNKRTDYDDDDNLSGSYYSLGVKPSDADKYFYDSSGEMDWEYDEQAYYKDLYNNKTDLGQGYFIEMMDQGEAGWDEDAPAPPDYYVLSQKEGYEALNPNYTSYDPEPKPPVDVGVPEMPGPPDPVPPTPPETPPEAAPPTPPPVNPKDIVNIDPPAANPPVSVPQPVAPVTPPGEVPPDPPEPVAPPVVDPPGSPTNPITPRSPYAGLEEDDEERGRPRQGRRRTRTIMTSGLLSGAPVSRKTLLGG